MKIGKSHVFVLILALIIIYAAFVSGSGGYCSAREFFSGRHDEEDDACIAKLIKRADDGNSFAESRLRYPTMEYIKRVCEKGVESLGERERFYFERYSKDRCSAWSFKTPKSKDGEANATSGGGNLARGDTNATDGERNLTRAEANNGEADTTGSKVDKTKRKGNSTEEQNAGR
ncbi:hypothetical protein [uncultured Campylobacter sp.]|uniref:hypothetical protein n=1 Tax=uncultured Campylobacter sp. TaxID=218934 RepID=UPI002615B1B4|nr:hypothetical protein [uncultured Campylobacter sp.]